MKKEKGPEYSVINSLLNLSFVVVMLFGFLTTAAQDPHRFKEQVKQLKNAEHHFQPNKKRAVFTGSSSIRMWNDLHQRFPEYNVVNNGFGGSHFSDLIFYYDELIRQFKPEILFVYEGDNDVAGNKNPGEIMEDAKKLHQMIREDFPEVKIVFIAPKPSIARWNLKEQYERVNQKLERFANQKKNTEFADVWNAMLDENGLVFQDVFLEDNLHMNKKGYDIWEEVLNDYLH